MILSFQAINQVNPVVDICNTIILIAFMLLLFKVIVLVLDLVSRILKHKWDKDERNKKHEWEVEERNA